MKELPVKYVPGHEVTHPPGEAARTVDQDQSGEAADQEGAKLHGSGVDVVKLWVADREWKGVMHVGKQTPCTSALPGSQQVLCPPAPQGAPLITGT